MGYGVHWFRTGGVKEEESPTGRSLEELALCTSAEVGRSGQTNSEGGRSAGSRNFRGDRQVGSSRWAGQMNFRGQEVG